MVTTDHGTVLIFSGCSHSQGPRRLTRWSHFSNWENFFISILICETQKFLNVLLVLIKNHVERHSFAFSPDQCSVFKNSKMSTTPSFYNHEPTMTRQSWVHQLDKQVVWTYLHGSFRY